MANINTNICLDEAFWLRCKNAAAMRRISLNQLVKNGLALVLGDSEVIKVDADGGISNDLRGLIKKKKKDARRER